MSSRLGRSILIAVSLCCVTGFASASAMAATQTVNFDDITAGCSFSGPPLSDRYQPQGLTFSGNGGILNGSCSNFRVSAYSAPNFLAFSAYPSVGRPGPETVTFDSPANYVVLNVGSADNAGSVSLTAFDGSTEVAMSTTVPRPMLAPLTVLAPRITSVRLAFTGNELVVDDFTWRLAPAAPPPPPAPAPAPAPAPVPPVVSLSPPPPLTSNFTLGQNTVARDGTITVSLSAPGPGDFSAIGTTSSKSVSGAGLQSAKKKCKKGFVRGGKKCVAGTATYGTGSASAVAAGPVKLTIRPSAAAQRALKKGKRLTVALALSFQRAGGTATTKNSSISVKLAKRKGKR